MKLSDVVQMSSDDVLLNTNIFFTYNVLRLEDQWVTLNDDLIHLKKSHFSDATFRCHYGDMLIISKHECNETISRCSHLNVIYDIGLS